MLIDAVLIDTVLIDVVLIVHREVSDIAEIVPMAVGEQCARLDLDKSQMLIFDVQARLRPG